MSNNENQQTIAKRVSNWFTGQTEKIWVRLVLLALSVLAGILLLWLSLPVLDEFLNSTTLVNTGGVLILSLLTATLLWAFRTYDVKKALEKSEEGLKKSEKALENFEKAYKQNDFFDAMKRLVSDNPLDIDQEWHQFFSE